MKSVDVSPPVLVDFYWVTLDGDYTLTEPLVGIIKGVQTVMSFARGKLPEGIDRFEADYPHITVKSLFPIPGGYYENYTV